MYKEIQLSIILISNRNLNILITNSSVSVSTMVFNRFRLVYIMVYFGPPSCVYGGSGLAYFTVELRVFIN